jgi:peptidoglycan/LPS O-acetylase OafA/YrhL
MVKISDCCRRSRIVALRDTVEKRPPDGANVDVLDGIRGLAVLIVVMANTGFSGMGNHGLMGIWMFFELSAFLLTLQFIDKGGVAFRVSRLKDYALLRIKRILPAYYTLLGATYLFGGRSGWTLWLWPHLTFQRAEGLFWAIPQGMLFYLCLPLIIAGVHFVLRSRTVPTILALAALAIATDRWLDVSILGLPGLEIPGAPKVRPFELSIFLCGIIAAYAHRSPAIMNFVEHPTVSKILRWWGFVALFGILVTAPELQRDYFSSIPILRDVPGGLSRNRVFCGVLFASLIFAVASSRAGVLKTLFESIALRMLGVVSFGIYLLHMHVRQKLVHGGMESGIELFTSVLVITTGIALALYAAIERPFLLSSRGSEISGCRGTGASAEMGGPAA